MTPITSIPIPGPPRPRANPLRRPLSRLRRRRARPSRSRQLYRFGQPGARKANGVTSAYFNDAVFIGDSLTTGIQLYNILPDTTVLAAVGVGLENIYTQEVIGTEDSKQTILEAADAQQPAKIYVMLGINGLKGLGADKTVELYRDLVQHLKETHPDSIIYVQSFMPSMSRSLRPTMATTSPMPRLMNAMKS